jgi:hypothetical protein
MRKLHQLILKHVRDHRGSEVDGEIRIAGVDEQHVLEATKWLVTNGYLKGAFPPNPNSPWRSGYEWGFVSTFQT